MAGTKSSCPQPRRARILHETIWQSVARRMRNWEILVANNEPPQNVSIFTTLIEPSHIFKSKSPQRTLMIDTEPKGAFCYTTDTSAGPSRSTPRQGCGTREAFALSVCSVMISERRGGNRGGLHSLCGRRRNAVAAAAVGIFVFRQFPPSALLSLVCDKASLWR